MEFFRCTFDSERGLFMLLHKYKSLNGSFCWHYSEPIHMHLILYHLSSRSKVDLAMLPSLILLHLPDLLLLALPLAGSMVPQCASQRRRPLPQHGTDVSIHAHALSSPHQHVGQVTETVAADLPHWREAEVGVVPCNVSIREGSSKWQIRRKAVMRSIGFCQGR